jgi:two-component system nitrogen regulation sensor histidine kinase GlnL
MRRLRSQLKPSAKPAETGPPWEEVLASFADAVVVTDEISRIVFFNHAAEALRGIPQARALGRTCAEVFHRTPLIGGIVERVQRSGHGESRGEERLYRAGEAIPVRITCIPLWDKRDRIRGTALVIHDLTHQKTLEEAARRNESLARLGTLVAGLAHEIKNPLAGIKGAAQLLDGRLVDEPDLRQYTSVITREVDRLSGLVEDLLTLGAPRQPRLERFNIHRAIQNVLSVLQEELTQRKIHLRCEFDPSLPDVQGDEAQLSQVFLNLLKNAMEAMTADGVAHADRSTITISTRIETDYHLMREEQRSGQCLRVEFADQGKGIDPADATKIFEPFFTTKPRGTGLGLAISHRIVADHGGIIRARSEKPWGAVFTVTLPVATGQ